jgi:hypothetical protein
MATDLNYLIPRLRLKLGDLTPPYKYMDEWLHLSLVASIDALQRWWNDKYQVDINNRVSPSIQRRDIQPIVLMACIILKSGSLENFSWNVGSWRDAEISFSNIEGSRGKQDSLKQDWDELNRILTSPNKKLVGSVKGHLPGYTGNQIEMGQGDEYKTFIDTDNE